MSTRVSQKSKQANNQARYQPKHFQNQSKMFTEIFVKLCFTKTLLRVPAIEEDRIKGIKRDEKKMRRRRRVGQEGKAEVQTKQNFAQGHHSYHLLNLPQATADHAITILDTPGQRICRVGSCLQP